MKILWQNNFACMHFHFRSMQISFISKVTLVHKATTITNCTRLCSTILFFEFHLGQPDWNFPHEQTTNLIPVTKPALLVLARMKKALVSLSQGVMDLLFGAPKEVLWEWSCLKSNTPMAQTSNPKQSFITHYWNLTTLLKFDTYNIMMRWKVKGVVLTQ